MTKKQRSIGVGVVWNDDQSQILIDRRLDEGDFANYWEFPGGKIEVGEDAPTCIQRELMEELGITVTVGDLLLQIDHEYPNICVSLFVHHCQIVSGTPQTLQCAEIMWVDVADLANYNFPEANYQIIEVLCQWQKERQLKLQ
ncbi:MAG: 8-oxo-dGTP diphosphatase MutT [Pseudanabaena sp. ELA607]|jgi:mutator protein MutT